MSISTNILGNSVDGEVCSRNWRITSNDSEDAKFEVTLKIRGEETVNFVPEKLYCSHKYHVIMNIQFPSRLIGKLPKVIVCKIRVVKGQTEELVLKKGKSIIKGVVTTGLQRNGKRGRKKNPVVYGGRLRIQFCASSYHFKKAHFAMKLDFFDPDDPESKLLELTSPTFQSFSRKPTVGKMTLEPETSKPLLIRKKKKKKKSHPHGAKKKTIALPPLPPSVSRSSNVIFPPPPPPPQPTTSIMDDDDDDDVGLIEEDEVDLIGEEISNDVEEEPTKTTKTEEEKLDGMDDEQLYKKYVEQLEKVKNLKRNLTVEEDLVAEDMTLQKLMEQDPPVNNDNPNHNQQQQQTQQNTNSNSNTNRPGGDGFEIADGDLDGLLDFSTFDFGDGLGRSGIDENDY